MALFNFRLSDDLAARFDAWASARGGRSAALRRVIGDAAKGQPSAVQAARSGPRPVKLTVRLATSDAHGLATAAAGMGLTPNAWAAALIRRRLSGRPTFGTADALSLVAIQTELRRIGVNANQIARALNTAVLEGKVLELELAYLDDLRAEIRAHMLALREAFEGNLAYWDAGP